MKNVFVFGSNLAGRHGAGAAKAAVKYHGAIYGQGVGPQGNSYAIPTKDMNLQSLPLAIIEDYVKTFNVYAKSQKDTVFNLTAIGCGLAGYTPSQIAPFFKDAPENVIKPVEFLI